MQNSDFLKNKFEHFNADVPTEVWDNLAAALDNKKKRRAAIWWFSGIAAVLILGLSVGYVVIQNENAAPSFEAKSSLNHIFTVTPTFSHNQIFNDPNSKPASENRADQANETERSFPNNTRDKHKRNGTNHDSTPPPFQELPDAEVIVEIVENPVQENDENAMYQPINTDSAMYIAGVDVREDFENQMTLNQVQPSQNIGDPIYKPRKWEFALLGGFSATRQQNSPYFLESSIANSPNLDFTANNADYLNISASSSNFISPVIRFTLIKAGFSINRELLPRWRLESGLHYLRFGVFYENSQVWSRETQMVQMPVSAHYAVIQANRIDWRLGSGVGMSYVFKQANPVFRGEWFNNTTILYKINPSWSIFLQPEARVVFYDSRIQGMGKLSQWYWGANLGVVMRF